MQAATTAHITITGDYGRLRVMSSFTLILLIVAIIVVVRLYLALGSRNKNYDEQRRAYRGLYERVLRGARAKPAPDDAPSHEDDGAVRPPAGSASSPSPVTANAALEQISAREPNFSLPQFLLRAEKAYRLILQHYADGKEDKLKPLVSANVFAEFARAIAARRKAGQSLETEILSLARPRVLQAEVSGARAELELAFDSDMISVLRDAQGACLEGDDNQAMAVSDVWRFRRRLGETSPIWRVVQTATELRDQA